MPATRPVTGTDCTAPGSSGSGRPGTTVAWSNVVSSIGAVDRRSSYDDARPTSPSSPLAGQLTTARVEVIEPAWSHAAGAGATSSGSATARNAFKRPPVRFLPASAGSTSTVASRRALASNPGAFPYFERMSATTPATCGADAEVPPKDV